MMSWCFAGRGHHCALLRMRDDFDGKVPLKIINLPNFRDRYRVVEVDEAVKAIVEDFNQMWCIVGI